MNILDVSHALSGADHVVAGNRLSTALKSIGKIEKNLCLLRIVIVSIEKATKSLLFVYGNDSKLSNESSQSSGFFFS